MKSEDITGGLDLLGDWLDAKGYTEEAGLCTRAMDEINRLREALKPFAEQYDAVEKEFGLLLLPDDANSMVKYADLRAARTAMGESDG